MYNLDSQLNFTNDEGLFKLGTWLHRKVLACKAKANEAEQTLADCGVAEEVLYSQWQAQIQAQTAPLPHM